MVTQQQEKKTSSQGHFTLLSQDMIKCEQFFGQIENYFFPLNQKQCTWYDVHI